MQVLRANNASNKLERSRKLLRLRDRIEFGDVWTYDGSILSGGGVDGDQVICLRHGAMFSIRTAEALTAPAYEPTSTFPVKVEGGEVFVRDDRWE